MKDAKKRLLLLQVRMWEKYDKEMSMVLYYEEMKSRELLEVVRDPSKEENTLERINSHSEFQKEHRSRANSIGEWITLAQRGEGNESRT